MRSPDEFTRAYIEAALWSSTDDDQPLDDDYDIESLSPETYEAMCVDCETFQAFWGNLWENAETSREWSIDVIAGHHFWLTRNGHGIGFWAYPEIYDDDNAERLTTASKSFGEVCLYVGDDGQIWS